MKPTLLRSHGDTMRPIIAILRKSREALHIYIYMSREGKLKFAFRKHIHSFQGNVGGGGGTSIIIISSAKTKKTCIYSKYLYICINSVAGNEHRETRKY